MIYPAGVGEPALDVKILFVSDSIPRLHVFFSIDLLLPKARSQFGLQAADAMTEISPAQRLKFLHSHDEFLSSTKNLGTQGIWYWIDSFWWPKKCGVLFFYWDGMIEHEIFDET